MRSAQKKNLNQYFLLQKAGGSSSSGKFQVGKAKQAYGKQGDRVEAINKNFKKKIYRH